MTVSTEQIKELRESTGAGMLDCREALDKSDGDIEKAMEYLREKGLAKATKRAGREASNGTVETYSHGGGRVGVMVEVNCETDFVARNETFQEFAHEIALQIAAESPLWVNEEQIPEEVLEKKREEAKAFAKEEGKPDNVIDKIVEGRMTKYLNDTVLLRQEYIRDDSLIIQDLLHEKVAFLGENIVIRRFQRYELGETTLAEEEEEE